MLEIRDLTRRFGARTAVDGVTLSIPAGQMVGVIGRSGAGKSTLLRMINRLQEPSSGSISFGTADVTALRGQALRDWRCACAMIFQGFNLVPRLYVLTNVLMGRLNHRGQWPACSGCSPRRSGRWPCRRWTASTCRGPPCSAPAPCQAGSSSASRSAGR